MWELPINYTLGNRHETFHIRYGAHLPHWAREGGVYAVTFRLSDSLPQSVLISWITERDHIIQNADLQKRPLSELEEKRLRQLYSQKVESYLDAGHGECALRRSDVAHMMSDTLRYFDQPKTIRSAGMVYHAQPCACCSASAERFRPIEHSAFLEILFSHKG